MTLLLSEYLDRFPGFKEKFDQNPEIILDIFNTSEVVAWGSLMRKGKHKLLPCRCGITYCEMPVEQYDEINKMNKYFQKLYIIDKKKDELGKDFE